MLTRETMFEPMLVADPTFQNRWKAFQDEWGDEPEPPLYLALQSLAEHLLHRLKNGDTDGFGRIFAVVEQWHVLGDAYVSEAATIGLLESIQNLSGGNQRNPTIERWLGPVSRSYWNKLDRFWGGDRSALGRKN